jgi:hypothetical protein
MSRLHPNNTGITDSWSPGTTTPQFSTSILAVLIGWAGGEGDGEQPGGDDGKDDREAAQTGGGRRVTQAEPDQAGRGDRAQVQEGLAARPANVEDDGGQVMALRYV